MFPNRFVTLAALFAGWSLWIPTAASAAQKPAAAAKAPIVKRRPGHVVGRCVSAQGKPLPGVRIRVFGVTAAGRDVNFEARTGADGLYAVKLPAGNFHVGWALFDAPAPKGPAYSLPLHPVDGSVDDGPSGPGIVENFVLKLSGRISPLADAENELSYYGGTIRLSGGAIPNAGLFDDTRYRFPSGSSLELTLTPQGRMPDGSTGKVHVLRKAVKDGTTFLDVPVGEYTIAASLVTADGTTKPLRVAVARYGTGSHPIRFAPGPDEFAAAGRLYFPSSGDATPLLKMPGVGYAEVYVLP